MAKRRSNGEGCIYKDTRSGKWKGKFEIGYDAKVIENSNLVQVIQNEK